MGYSKTLNALHLVPADGIGGVEIAASSMKNFVTNKSVIRVDFIENNSNTRHGILKLIFLIKDNIDCVIRNVKIKPNVVICSLWKSVLPGIIIHYAIPNSKFVYFIHSDRHTHIFDRFFSYLAIKIADEVWGDSRATLEMRGVNPSRSQVISFVIDKIYNPTKMFCGMSFISWGRLHYLKGIDRSIRFIADLSKRGHDVNYNIYGPDAGHKAYLEELVHTLGMNDRIKFHGSISRDAIVKLSNDSSFFLQLSRAEGMCMAAVEAMQIGLVPVTTAVGEMANYVIPDVTGVIVDADNMDKGLSQVEELSSPVNWNNKSSSCINYWKLYRTYAEDFFFYAKKIHYK